MSQPGLWQICEAATAEQQCRHCGALVCSTHYDEATGLCTECVAAVGRREERVRES
jgi:hypothetical protein